MKIAPADNQHRQIKNENRQRKADEGQIMIENARQTVGAARKEAVGGNKALKTESRDKIARQNHYNMTEIQKLLLPPVFGRVGRHFFLVFASCLLGGFDDAVFIVFYRIFAFSAAALRLGFRCFKRGMINAAAVLSAALSCILFFAVSTAFSVEFAEFLFCTVFSVIFSKLLSQKTQTHLNLIICGR